MSIDVHLDALSDDARKWRDVAKTLGAASGAVQGLRLEGEFSFAGTMVGLPAAYEDLVNLAARLLQEGHDVTNSIADTLLDTRATYESADEAERARYERLWTVD